MNSAKLIDLSVYNIDEQARNPQPPQVPIFERVANATPETEFQPSFAGNNQTKRYVASTNRVVELIQK